MAEYGRANRIMHEHGRDLSGSETRHAKVRDSIPKAAPGGKSAAEPRPMSGVRAHVYVAYPHSVSNINTVRMRLTRFAH